VYIKSLFSFFCLLQDDRCLHVALPVAAFLEMPTKPVNSRATTATRAGCVQHRLGRNMPFKARQQICCQRWPKT